MHVILTDANADEEWEQEDEEWEEDARFHWGL
jgi:hypothetical protein